MLSKLKAYWQRLITGSDRIPEIKPSLTVSAKQPHDAVFDLSLGNLLVGTLEWKKGAWIFSYSDGFKRQTKLRPIVQFPEKSKVYESEELWPFFGMRIPSLKQPSVKAIIDRENISTASGVDLLRRFGRRTVANPFELTAHGP